MLDDLVFQCGDSERPFPSVRLLDLYPSRWKCPVGSAMQPAVQINKSILQPGFILLPRHAVHSRRSSAV